MSFNFNTLKTLRRYVEKDKITLEKNGEDYHVSYTNEFKSRWDRTLFSLAWGLKAKYKDEDYEQEITKKTEKGWYHYFKIGKSWLNEDRIKALDLIIQEKEDHKIKGIKA